MTPREACLIALAEMSVYGDDHHYYPFHPIQERSGYDRATVRRCVRLLKRQGQAKFMAGLCTEDGDFAGSGYRCTSAGIEAARALGADV